MNLDPMRAVVLLAVAMLVAIVTRRLSLPYTVGLVLVGVALAVARIDIGGALTHDFIFFVILPPLLFEAALALRWRDLRADAGLLFVLATLGTLLAAAIVAWGMVALLHWPLPAALVFGALIAATDPVAVIAMFKDNGVHGRLRSLMESESLFNDAAAAIVFAIALSFAMGDGVPTPADMVMHLGYVVVGGTVIGAAVGGLMLFVAGRTTEHVIEVALTVLAAYGAFLIAEQLHASGILATVVAGLVVGNVGLASDGSTLSDRAREFAIEFWEFAAFLANSTIFPLIGVSVGAAAFTPDALPGLIAAVLFVLIGRAVTIYPLSLAFTRTKQAVPRAFQHVLWWGGLRGALALALALALPENMIYRREILVTTFAVVAFSIIVQGLTMPMLLRKLGLVAKAG
jgi:CPA1 family monovalent cation:H+ antiporter